MDSDTLDLVCLVAAYASLTVAIVAQRKARRRRKRNRQVQPRYLRPAILRPVGDGSTTPWRRLLRYGSNRDFITALNFTRNDFFNILLPYFEMERKGVNFGSPYRMGPKVRGRRPHVTGTDLLGIALWYLKTSSNQYAMCPVFGFVPTSINVWLDYALEVLLQVVKKKDRQEFVVKWPSSDEMIQSNNLLKENRQNGRVLDGIFAVVDGGRIPCAEYTDKDLQNAYYEGYTQSVEVTNLFVWNFKGEIIHAGVNFPGSWHDSKLAYASGLIYPKLSDRMTPPGFAILGDSAFAVERKVSDGKIVRSRKSNERAFIPESLELAAIDTILQRVMPSERQSAEWGVRAIKGTFGRLKVPLSADSSKRKRLLRICVHLFNFRTRYVGLNQIRTTFSKDGTSQPWIEQ